LRPGLCPHFKLEELQENLDMINLPEVYPPSAAPEATRAGKPATGTAGKPATGTAGKQDRQDIY